PAWRRKGKKGDAKPHAKGSPIPGGNQRKPKASHVPPAVLGQSRQQPRPGMLNHPLFVGRGSDDSDIGPNCDPAAIVGAAERKRQRLVNWPGDAINRQTAHAGHDLDRARRCPFDWDSLRNSLGRFNPNTATRKAGLGFGAGAHTNGPALTGFLNGTEKPNSKSKIGLA